MSFIDESFKKLIQEKNAAPNETQKNNIDTWIKSWLTFCLHALESGYLNESFKRLLDEKIMQTEREQMEAHEVALSASITGFLTEVLAQCNEECKWFNPECLSSEKIKDDIFMLEFSPLTKEINQLLERNYDAYCREWFEKKLHIEQGEVFYEKALPIFLEAYHLGLIGDAECKKIIGSLLKEIDNDAETLHIKQNNGRIIYQSFLNFLTKHHFLPETLEKSEQLELIKSAIHHALPVIESSQRTNDLFNATVMQFITNGSGASYSDTLGYVNSLSHGSQFKQDRLSLVLSQHNHLASKEINSLIDIIAKSKFKTIAINHESNLAFSYAQEAGVLINDGFLNESQVESVNLLTYVASYEQKMALQPKQPSYGSYRSFDLPFRLHQLAAHIIDHHSSNEFYLDDEISFSRLGEKGVKAYLTVLNDKFVKQLKNNEIDKAYSLFIPLKINTLLGINHFISHQHDINNDYIFCCHRLDIDIDTTEEANVYIDALCELILLLDKSKLNQLNINVTQLDKHDIEALSKALEQARHTRIRFKGLKEIDDAIQLEAINDLTLQPVVAFNLSCETESANLAPDISNQPQPVTLAKIKAHLNTEIDLRPIQSKIGFQNQHHYQQQAQQKTEVKIRQSWQIEQAKETRHESRHGHGILFGNESSTLISWQDIQAACHPSDPQHEASCIKLGEEIMHYEYKGRNLIDLWQRITGDVALTGQNKIPHAQDEFSSSYRYFSPSIPKRISYKTLLTIVRHPHLFQHGVHLESLPESFFYNSIEGALFTDASNLDDHPQPFAPRFTPVPTVFPPSAEHFFRLENSKLASLSFLQDSAYPF